MPKVSRDKLYEDFFDNVERMVEETNMFSRLIEGASETEVMQLERQLKKKLPRALRAWYKRFGHYPGDWSRNGTYKADLTIRDLLYAAESASRFLTRNFANPWHVSRWTLPISNDIFDKFWCVWLDMGDDPPVYLQDEGDPLPRRVAVSFSSHIRQIALGAIERALHFNSMDFYHQRFMERTKNISQEERSKQSDERRRQEWILWHEIDKLHKQFTEQIHTEDIARGQITSPEQFQERWMNDFAKTDLVRQYSAEEFWIHWNWTLPQKDAWGIYKARLESWSRTQ